MEDVCISVKKNVDSFVDEAPQFDDITMLAFKFDGGLRYEVNRY